MTNRILLSATAFSIALLSREYVADDNVVKKTPGVVRLASGDFALFEGNDYSAMDIHFYSRRLPVTVIHGALMHQVHRTDLTILSPVQKDETRRGFETL